MKLSCPNCGVEIATETLPFGKEYDCPACHVHVFVDYDYSGEFAEDLSFWLTLKEPA